MKKEELMGNNKLILTQMGSNKAHNSSWTMRRSKNKREKDKKGKINKVIKMDKSKKVTGMITMSKDKK